jgi:hypothetical protein
MGANEASLFIIIMVGLVSHVKQDIKRNPMNLVDLAFL